MQRIDTREYENSHGKVRAQHTVGTEGVWGAWCFRANTAQAKQAVAAGDYSQVRQVHGTYSEAKRLLGAGEWVLLP